MQRECLLHAYHFGDAHGWSGSVHLDRRLPDCCRLAADTTTVSDQVCLNLNVALRSVTQADMMLVFMFAAYWRLTVSNFDIVPVILAICKLYGQYYR